MGQTDVELAGFFGSRPLVTGCFGDPLRSIGFKRSVLSVAVTVNLRNDFENFSSRAGLRGCETIEWE